MNPQTITVVASKGKQPKHPYGYNNQTKFSRGEQNQARKAIK